VPKAAAGCYNSGRTLTTQDFLAAIDANLKQAMARR
jgi:hypothetical protein